LKGLRGGGHRNPLVFLSGAMHRPAQDLWPKRRL
jgi:hypothetical protein